MRILCASAQDTMQLGAHLARTRPQQEALQVLYLHGDLGTGKTTFAQGFLAALGVQAPVRSPTYTLFEIYSLPAVTALHIDLYRLQSPAEFESLGLRDWARPDCLWLIEWPERAVGDLPPPTLELRFETDAQHHVVTLRPGTNPPRTATVAQAWLERLARG